MGPPIIKQKILFFQAALNDLLGNYWGKKMDRCPASPPTIRYLPKQPAKQPARPFFSPQASFFWARPKGAKEDGSLQKP